MEITERRFTMTSGQGETLFCDARWPNAAGAGAPALIFVHGFKGFKDWGSNPYVCRTLAERGFHVTSFNFSHNGVEGHSEAFTELARFEANTISREVSEIGDVIDAVAGLRVPGFAMMQPAQIGLIGHSRGGGIALLGASHDRRVRAVATWASVATFDRYTEAQKARWRRDGFLDATNTRTGQEMRLGVGYLNDIEKDPAALDVTAAAARLGRPLLIVHGEQDLSVRIDDGERLHSVADPALTEFERIENTGHTFGAVHPFEGTTPALERAIDVTAAFFERHLAG